MTDLNAMSLPRLYEHLCQGGLVRRVLELARDEDLGGAGDVTSELSVPLGARAEAGIVAREAGVAAGLASVPELLDVFGCSLAFERRVEDGERLVPGAVLGTLGGSLREILAVERTLLNMVGRLSGIATRTAEFVAALGTGVRAKIYDTRKTTPGLRVLEKYAVRCGGGMSHRLGLYDAVMMKDNHIAGVGLERLAEVVGEAARRAKARRGAGAPAFFEVEVDSLAQLERVLSVEPGLVDIVLLDNMAAGEMREAVAMRDGAGSGAQLEASGGVRLGTVRAIAETGVERISVGSLTHGASSLDVALDIKA